MLGRSVARRIAGGKATDVWSDDVVGACAPCDCLVINLECCVSKGGSRTHLIPDKPFFFRSPPAGVEALGAIGTTVAGVANNHALDFGPEALADTLVHLREAGIAVPGAGLDEEEARKGALVRAGDLTLGVLAVSDHPAEFAAGPGKPGIAFADLRRHLPGWVPAELDRLRGEADLVLAFPHWGPNMTVSPARWQRRRADELIDAGAHAVAGHSAHVFHGIELLPGGPVLYDLGDALDDYAVDRELRNDLGILTLWRPDERPRLELVGLSLDFCHTRLASGADAEWIADRLTRACEELGTTLERAGDARFVVVE
jgi:poly-gamma-glutamate capsule biosynthesis protein CapA/YwtB (metallophosphatase superfamily)